MTLEDPEAEGAPGARPPRAAGPAAGRALRTLAPGLLLLVPALAHAHEADATASGFASGFLHPLAGLDHVLAMLAVGMWGAQLGMPALWVLPVAFPLVMALGGVLGIAGVPLPGVEVGITLSVIALGAAIALARRPPLALAALLVGLFAVFHGYAHGAELPGAAGALAYSAGFVLATGLIHVAGIGVGFVIHAPRGAELLRTGGAAIALAGVWLAWRLVGA